MFVYYVYYGYNLFIMAYLSSKIPSSIFYGSIFSVPMNSLMNTGADRLHSEAISVIS